MNSRRPRSDPAALGTASDTAQQGVSTVWCREADRWVHVHGTYRGVVSARPFLLAVAPPHDDTFLEVILGDAAPHLIADIEPEVKCG